MVMNAMGSNPYNHLKNKSKKPKNKHAPKENIHPKNHWTLHLEGYESVFRRGVFLGAENDAIFERSKFLGHQAPFVTLNPQIFTEETVVATSFSQGLVRRLVLA